MSGLDEAAAEFASELRAGNEGDPPGSFETIINGTQTAFDEATALLDDEAEAVAALYELWHELTPDEQNELGGRVASLQDARDEIDAAHAEHVDTIAEHALTLKDHGYDMDTILSLGQHHRSLGRAMDQVLDIGPASDNDDLGDLIRQATRTHKAFRS